jgi:hypothetical protein
VAIGNIDSIYIKATKEIQILSKYLSDSSSLEAKYQYIVSEVMMLRLFGIFESAIGDIAIRLACGAKYRNGNIPLLQHRCTSLDDAIDNMVNLNRTRRQRLRGLKWSNVNDIENCIKHVLNITDKFFVEIQNNSSLFDEMRIVRNHIAHRNSDTAKKYYAVLQDIYSANIRISLGAFLTSTARQPQPNIIKYIQSIPIILKDITNG